MEPACIEKEVEEAKDLGINQWLLKHLVRAFEDARKGKIKTYDEHRFEINWHLNLQKLLRSILERRYRPSPSKAFVIEKPMVREIFAAPFRDRIVHHFLYNMCAGWWDRHFIYDSYSCRIGKGTLFAQNRIRKMMQQASNGYRNETFVAKLDLKGYFMSLPRQKLYERVKWGLDQQFGKYKNDPMGHQIYLICDFLWRQIIFDDPAKKARRCGPRSDWNPDHLPPSKSLFGQVPGLGIVIGNLTSQLMSNIYLDMLDRFVKFDLGYKYYGRYVDDFIIIVPASEKEKLLKDIRKIEKFLKEELELTLHPKKRYFQSIYNGVEFVGAKICPHCLLPSKRLDRNFRNAANKFAYGYADIDSIVSYLGIMCHMSSGKLKEDVFDKFGWGE